MTNWFGIPDDFSVTNAITQLVSDLSSENKDTNKLESFFKSAEGYHGFDAQSETFSPMVSNDEKDKQSGNVTFDIGYGHKLTDEELKTNSIYGIDFSNGLTREQASKIAELDFNDKFAIALKEGWDKKLKDRGMSVDTIPEEYLFPLKSLAYNVGGRNAGKTWTGVLDAVKNNDPVTFAKELRRQDNGKYTAGMDNRVVKELVASGLMTDKNEKEILKKLPKASLSFEDALAELY